MTLEILLNHELEDNILTDVSKEGLKQQCLFKFKKSIAMKMTHFWIAFHFIPFQKDSKVFR